MQREREVVLLGQGDLCGKDRTLCVEIRTAQTVEAAFAHLHHFGQGEEVGEGGEVAVELKSASAVHHGWMPAAYRPPT